MEGQRLFLLAVLLAVPAVCVAITCLECTDSPAPKDCGKIKRCGTHEACFIEKFATAAGIRYNVGCRDTRFCISSGRRSVDYNTSNVMLTSSDDVIVRSSGNVKMCESCCNSDLCNNAGCGVAGYPARQNRGPVCYTCAQQRSPELCDSISVCGLNSICKVKLDAHLTTGDIYYTSKCQDPQVCHQDAVFQNLIVVGRKRLTEEVDTASHKCVVKCCDGDLCNGNCGTGSVSGTSGTGSGTNPCLSNPCVYGSCSVYSGSYVCTCTNGATGRNCDHMPNPCANNPCVYGSCHHTGASYSCQCTNGYTGKNCDLAPDPCSARPCNHGVCHKSGSSYYCTCNSGYTGSRCDQLINPCSGSPCGQHGVCRPSGSSYNCACYHGWSGSTCSQYTGSVSHSCSSGWLKHGSSCYYFDKSKHSWNDAKSRCSSYSAYLAEVNDGSEQSFLVQNGPVAHKGDWWIGGSCSSGRCHWDHDGRTVNGHWDSGYPKSGSGTCVELHKVSHGAWRNEDSCSHGNYYVCEKSALWSIRRP